MDNGPSFSHLVMQRSFPTKTQQMSRIIAVPPRTTRVSDVCPSDTEDTKNPWLLGKMLESGFPDASGREEG